MARGLVLGKFLPYHLGHAHLIRSARAQVDTLTVLVCSIAAEPIPGETRFRWVAEAHPDCQVVHVSEEVPQAPEDDPRFWEIWTDLIARHAGEVDVVFTSESYGDELAGQLRSRHVCVDLARFAFPVSGTRIRDDPLRWWDYIPANVRPSYVHRVAIVGAESTGKTMLAERLAKEFATSWAPEFGRAYCEGRDVRELSLEDFDAIARGHMDAEDAAAGAANRVLICDTDVRTTLTWSEMIRGEHSPWLEQAATEREYSHVLLLAPDVPWIDDGTRVLGAHRDRHTSLLERELERTGQSYTRIEGPYDERFRQAVAEVARVLATPVKPRFGAPGIRADRR